MITDGPSPDSSIPPKGWFGVYRRLTIGAFEAKLDASFEHEDQAVRYAEARSNTSYGVFLVVNPKGFTVASFGRI